MAGKLSHTLRIAATPILIGLVAWMEAKQSLPAFRLLTFIVVFLLFAVVASLLRDKWRDGALLLAALAFGLCLVEAFAVVWEPKQSLVTTKGWSVQQPIVGWGAEHAGRYHAEKTDPKTGAVIYTVDYTIDSNLLRHTYSSDTGPTIVFFGDSFTFGLGVNDADTLPQLLADALDRKQRVLNLGVGGYGPQQFLRELETGLFDSVIGSQPKLFIFMTAAWHAERTACKYSWGLHAPLYALENDRVAFKGACYEGISLRLQEWLWNTAAYRFFIARYRQKVSHDDIELYVRILLAAVNLAKEKYGVPTLVPYLQAENGYFTGTGFSDEGIIKRLRDGGALVIDASLVQEEAGGATISIPGDGHPTPLANRVRAAMLKNYISQHMSEMLLSGLQ